VRRYEHGDTDRPEVGHYACAVPRVPDESEGGDWSAGPGRRDDLDVRFAAGDADLREVYDAHAGLVYGLCRRTLSAEAAAEVTQDVFVNAWRKRDQFDPERGTLPAWLVGITKRRVIDQVRSERRHDTRRAELDDPNEAAASLVRGPDETPIDRIADRMLVGHALERLPERTRDMIVLAFNHDLTHAEISERTGVPLGTVKSDIRRGLLKIREHLSQSEEVSP
jgi:RNA polymerase sigma factor (sigma-70 family)